MKTMTKMLVAGTMPALLAGAMGALAESTPATQAATQPATQPAAGAVAQSNAPLVLPDGTSLENPGPVLQRFGFEGEMMPKTGIRG